MKLSIVKIVMFLGCCMTAFTAQGQQLILGTVTGPDGPVVGATVRITSSQEGTVTNVEGNFELEAESEDITLEIRSIGYKTRIASIQLPVDEPLVIQLEESSLGLDEVVITGTLEPVFVSQSPIKTEVLTTKHFNTFMPSASANLVDAMTMVNGIQEVVSCGVCFTNSLSVNGLEGQYTAILVDGTPMYGNLASVYGLNSIPGIMVDRIEVIKGPGSTLYGSEAVAGVINIITRNPENEPVVAGDVMSTTHGEIFANAALSLSTGKASSYSGVNYSGMHRFIDDNQDGFGDIINIDRLSLFSKWNVPLNKSIEATIAAKYMFEDRRNGLEAFLADPSDLRGNDESYGESIRTHRLEIFGNISGPRNIQMDYSFSSHDQDSYYGSDHYVAEQHIGFLNTYKRINAGRHSLTGGLTLRYQYYDDNTVATPDGADKQFIPGVFLQDEWDLSNRITIIGGWRTDHYRRHGLIHSPRFSLKWQAGKWTTLRFNSGTGFRVVNLFTEDHAFVTGQRSVEITEDLEPERSVNAAVNLNHVLALGSSQAVIDVDVFYTRFTNKILPDYETPGKIIYSNTGGIAQTRGIALSWRQEFSFPLEVTAGLTWMRAFQTDQEGNEERLLFAPDLSGLLNISYTFKKPGILVAWSANFTGQMALPEVFDLDNTGSPVENPRPELSEAFQIHNLQISKQMRSFRIYGGVSNIFNYMQPVSPLSGFNDPAASPGFSQFFDTAYSFAPLHGREFFIGIGWTPVNK